MPRIWGTLLATLQHRFIPIGAKNHSTFLRFNRVNNGGAMSASFNLFDQPWIPCIDEGGTLVELSLREVVTTAHNLREVQDASPLVTAGLHRLLLALLHRTFPLRNESDWLELWRGGSFDSNKAEEYLAANSAAFDLFDEERPFFQVAKFTVNALSPVSQLALEEVSGNNPILFDHRLDDTPDPVSPAAAARQLIATQNYLLGFGQSAKPEIDGVRVVSHRIDTGDGPLARGATLLLYGNNLFETLMLNMVDPSFRDPALKEDGLPVWERIEPDPPSEQRAPRGYLDLLTWPSRWIRLIPETDQDGNTVVTHAYIAQGSRLPKVNLFDTMKRYQKDAKVGFIPTSLRVDKALWRNSAAWLEQVDRQKSRDVGSIAPASVRQATHLLDDGHLDDDRTLDLRVFGYGTKPGKAAAVYFWRSESLAIPSVYLSDPATHVERLRDCLMKAEQGCQDLTKALRSFAHRYFEHQRGDGAKGNSAKSDKKVDNFVHQSGIERRYWPALEQPFNQLLHSLPINPDPSREMWVASITSAMRTALDDVLRGMPQRGRDLEAIQQAKGILGARINAMKRQTIGEEVQ